MTIKEYYFHTRRLGFRAVDCLKLAREAAYLDCKTVGASLASYEVCGDTTPIRLSFQIKVY